MSIGQVESQQSFLHAAKLPEPVFDRYLAGLPTRANGILAGETSVIPTLGLEDYITGLARQHGIRYERTPGDAMADVITALADDELKMDGVILLLLALERAGVVPSEEVVPIHINYLREKFNVRPAQD